MAGTIFLSRSGKDKGIALPLIEACERRGLKVLVQDHDVLTGDDFKAFMDSALREAQATVALISTPYLRSEWCRRETRAADGLEKHRLIPLVIEEGCRPDGLLASLVYCDVASLLTNGIDDIARLIAEILASGKPIEASLAVREYLRRAEFFRNVSFSEGGLCIGRDTELSELERYFWQGGESPGVKVATVHGLGGVGKTTLALTYAVQNLSRYSGVWRIRAQVSTSLISDLARLGSELLAQPNDGKEEDARTCLHEIEKRPGRPILLVFDNVEGPGCLTAWLPLTGAHVIATSQWRDWRSINGKFIPVEALTPTAATELLLTLSERTERKAAAELSELLGRLPLALTHAGATLRQAKALSFANYAADLSHRLAILPKGAGEYPVSARAALESNLAMMSRDDPSPLALLQVAAFCEPDRIPIELVQFAAASPDLKVFVSGPIDIAQALGVLESWSIIKLDPSAASLAIHRLVQLVLRTRYREDGILNASISVALSGADALWRHYENQEYYLGLRSKLTALAGHIALMFRDFDWSAPTTVAAQLAVRAGSRLVDHEPAKGKELLELALIAAKKNSYLDQDQAGWIVKRLSDVTWRSDPIGRGGERALALIEGELRGCIKLGLTRQPFHLRLLVERFELITVFRDLTRLYDASNELLQVLDVAYSVHMRQYDCGSAAQRENRNTLIDDQGDMDQWSTEVLDSLNAAFDYLHRHHRNLKTSTISRIFWWPVLALRHAKIRGAAKRILDVQPDSAIARDYRRNLATPRRRGGTRYRKSY